ncbi:tRNA threonylcarbamoyl adenosine modification protein YeaZ [Roseivivax lentus]|uniref:tRNA threonylcarbamoyl adenosine modification protein YeaZ n=1 Tax=Roseivivax lentus TaxID=633194 RepID=A0A1N7KY28_9RHOB|nr:tRNA (adenosine(37)-N6)-threonylcarbamoyltransferase complex dimerization subunit type 1 TsaB [Roseivivax lentus]SIS66542.1 tRNA threonylcarbamoyl adenosine modification protein YeaZ [Roseivivax lentus]
MASDRLILGFDTSAAHCAAALLSGDRVLGISAEEMRQGQAERLMPMLEQVLAQAGAGWADLSRIGVGTGPGNFTGIRIAVSAARGLALALDIPAIGVTSFEATDPAPGSLPAVAAPREQVYLHRPGAAPILAALSDIAEPLTYPPDPATLARNIARRARDGMPGAAPAPLYIRPADAAPARDAAPAILP